MPVKGPLRKVDYEKMYDSVRGIMDEVGLGHRKPTDMVRILSVAEKTAYRDRKSIFPSCKDPCYGRADFRLERDGDGKAVRTDL